MFCSREKGWRRFVLGLLVCAALFQVSCRDEKSRAKRPIDFVPSEADVIAVVDYKGFISSDVLRRVFDISQVERTLLTVGISSENILGLAGFAKINLPALVGGVRGPSEESPGEFGIIVQGKGGFGPVFIALSESGWAHREYEGKSFWVMPEEKMAVASVGSDMLTVGTPAAVRQVIDVAVGKAPRAMSPGADSDCGMFLRRIGISGQINIAISFSKEMKMAARDVSGSAGIFGGMTGANIFGQLFDLLGTGQGIALSFTGAKNVIASRLVFAVRDAGSAKLIAGLVRVAKIVIPRIGDLGQIEGAAEMVRGLHVHAENNLVLIGFKIPETILTPAPCGQSGYREHK